MKWLLYATIFSVVSDVAAIENGLRNGSVDVMFAGFFMVILLRVLVVFLLYSLIIVTVIEWRGWVDKRPFLAYFLASPIYFYVFFHPHIWLVLVILHVLLVCVAALFGHRKASGIVKSKYKSVIEFFNPPPRNRAWKKDWK